MVTFDHVKAPRNLFSPLTSNIMKEPVTISSGQTYDKESIHDWLGKGNEFRTKTGQVVASLDYTSDVALNDLIDNWKVKNLDGASHDMGRDDTEAMAPVHVLGSEASALATSLRIPFENPESQVSSQPRVSSQLGAAASPDKEDGFLNNEARVAAGFDGAENASSPSDSLFIRSVRTAESRMGRFRLIPASRSISKAESLDQPAPPVGESDSARRVLSREEREDRGQGASPAPPGLACRLPEEGMQSSDADLGLVSEVDDTVLGVQQGCNEWEGRYASEDLWAQALAALSMAVPVERKGRDPLAVYYRLKNEKSQGASFPGAAASSAASANPRRRRQDKEVSTVPAVDRDRLAGNERQPTGDLQKGSTIRARNSTFGGWSPADALRSYPGSKIETTDGPEIASDALAAYRAKSPITAPVLHSPHHVPLEEHARSNSMSSLVGPLGTAPFRSRTPQSRVLQPNAKEEEEEKWDGADARIIVEELNMWGLETSTGEDRPALWQRAAERMRMLTKQSERYRELLMEAGAAKPLVKCAKQLPLGSEATEHCVTALLNMALSPNLQPDLVDAGVCEAAMRVLLEGTGAARDNAAALVYALTLPPPPMANHPSDLSVKVAKYLVNAGVVPLLLEMLASVVDNGQRSMRGAKDSAVALFNLTVCLPAARMKMVQEGAIPLLTKILDKERALEDRVTALLPMLARTEGGTCQLAESGTVRFLMEILSDGSERAKEDACCTLLMVVKAHPEKAREMILDGGISTLQHLIQMGTRRGKEKASELVGILHEASALAETNRREQASCSEQQEKYLEQRSPATSTASIETSSVPSLSPRRNQNNRFFFRNISNTH